MAERSLTGGEKQPVIKNMKFVTHQSLNNLPGRRDTTVRDMVSTDIRILSANGSKTVPSTDFCIVHSYHTMSVTPATPKKIKELTKSSIAKNWSDHYSEGGQQIWHCINIFFL
ncbi:hypothetical protein pdam_00007761 [Pocillopora damicornis]|uniref:Uncharacterized protein n=1 Tax=Pocillopora damicornis TaxID=46731 RepID=A0A3M6V4K6_POCDA|nr:hypothetical protein pdam_00007761 [Pocillopora damicornis]